MKKHNNPRVSVYIKDDNIYDILLNQEHKSEYVERAIRFYEENKGVLGKILIALEKHDRETTSKPYWQYLINDDNN